MKINDESKSVNISQIKQILTKENEFISSLWNLLPIKMENYNEDSDINSVVVASKKNKSNHQNSFKERAKTLEELHEKLQELKGKKSSYKDILKKKNIKKKLNKVKKKEEYKKTKNQNGHGNLQKQNISENKPKIPTKPIFTDEGKMVFSKFDFSNSNTVKKKKENPMKILEKLEIKKERIKKLEQHGNAQKAKEIKEKASWDAALKKAAGEKVKDNPDLLKKTIRTLKDKKNRSKKKWEAREEVVKKKQQEKQEKRTKSLQERKSRNKMNKMKKAAKKGRYIPGYINTT